MKLKAFILAAGLGTRLKPWTLDHPKALVPVGGKPMLLRVIENLKEQGVGEMTVNIHHFGEQILDFLSENNLTRINVSDETESLLDTGGALLKAKPFLCADDSPVLVHNVDILSNADFRNHLMVHEKNKADVTLLVSGRESSRRLIFDKENNLKGWHNLKTNEFRPSSFVHEEGDRELAFSGIYIISPALISLMEKDGFHGKFSIIDYLLSQTGKRKIVGYCDPELRLLDIGKPETLSQARLFFQ